MDLQVCQGSKGANPRGDSTDQIVVRQVPALIRAIHGTSRRFQKKRSYNSGAKGQRPAAASHAGHLLLASNPQSPVASCRLQPIVPAIAFYERDCVERERDREGTGRVQAARVLERRYPRGCTLGAMELTRVQGPSAQRNCRGWIRAGCHKRPSLCTKAQALGPKIGPRTRDRQRNTRRVLHPESLRKKSPTSTSVSNHRMRPELGAGAQETYRNVRAERRPKTSGMLCNGFDTRFLWRLRHT